MSKQTQRTGVVKSQLSAKDQTPDKPPSAEAGGMTPPRAKRDEDKTLEANIEPPTCIGEMLLVEVEKKLLREGNINHFILKPSDIRRLWKAPRMK